ncbi:tautomerase family protein [Luteirhabdus pelagi]|uniref:tautomerase family protein n=1 Tax=Luteirhabdus pelagi TaxID=2792783 RepID=UPI001939AC55|nr:tautomerase family protein [Luteirhabdus pelagi]
MPHFEIKLLEGKTEEEKKQLSSAVIEAAQKVIGYGNASYSVTIEDFTREEWKNEVYPNAIIGRKELLYKAPGYKM